jgi:dUTP pyrophosphatase
MESYQIHSRGFEHVKKEYLKTYESINDVLLPKRGSKFSAGYDFLAPYEFKLLPKTDITIWTDVKVFMKPDEFLGIYPRSSSMKRKIKLGNTIGVIDFDYYSNINNDGNIGINIYNYGDTPQLFKKGEGVAQSIFQKFLEAYNCNTNIIREGGIGSTTK